MAIDFLSNQGLEVVTFVTIIAGSPDTERYRTLLDIILNPWVQNHV